ncbi:integrin alpha [Elongatibacter sediminis]|uniref:Integrin alpha n=1 Tax=Elongatibacter sediminis TaxID=3119006 RepID=A0AAW9RCG3_9GAMM
MNFLPRRSPLAPSSLAAALAVLTASITPLPLAAQLIGSLDLATVNPGDGVYERILGSVGTGASGVPVSGGHDIDGDGHPDSAFAAMRASPQGRFSAGVVFLVFGDSTVSGTVDTDIEPHPTILEIHGDQNQENAGSELWMADVTGDGTGDLIICRQNYSPGGTRIGGGAVTILPGNAQLRTMATNGDILDLRSPPVGLPVVNIHGATAPSRLCIWARNGDVTGDGTDDLVVGADREDSNGDSDSGAVYVFRGGSHLATSQTIDLANFGSVSAGNIARIRPRASSMNFHLGATVQVADLDNNGRAEVIAAAALNRSGAALPPAGGTGEGSGGSPQGTLYIVWDDNFNADPDWIPAPDFIVDQGPGDVTIIDGGIDNDVFGEEILGGKDYDNDGKADLFSGDLTSGGWGGITRSTAGVAQVIYDIASLKGQEFDIDSPPEGFTMATFVGPVNNAIAGDTAMHGDFNGDGIDDLAFSSPHDNPLARTRAGTVHIILGQNGPWPTLSDLAPANFPESGVSIFEIYGAEGLGSPGAGDTLCYSAANGDMNGDGRIDLIFNEMQGDGSTAVDVGNMLLLDTTALFPDGPVFEDGFEDPE